MLALLCFCVATDFSVNKDLYNKLCVSGIVVTSCCHVINHGAWFVNVDVGGRPATTSTESSISNILARQRHDFVVRRIHWQQIEQEQYLSKRMQQLKNVKSYVFWILKNVKKRTCSFRGHLVTPVFNTQLPKVSTGKSPTSNVFAQKCGRSVHIHKKLCNL